MRHILFPIFAALGVVLASESQGALVHRYSFMTDAQDSAGTAHGVLQGGATVSGGALVLNGSGAFVDLPNNVVTGLTAITIEVWVTDNGSGNWARIFDFGNNTAGEGSAGSGTSYMFLTPGPGPGVLRAAYTQNGGGSEQIVQSTTVLPTGTRKHVVLATDGATSLGRLYVDGVLVGSNSGMTLTPALIGPTVNNWIGRSQWSADSYLNGRIDEFRIYDTALTETQIQQNFAYGPEVAAMDGPVAITGQPDSQTVVELRPAAFQVRYNGTRPVTVQWFRNGNAIPGATNEVLTIPAASLDDSGVAYMARLTNRYSGTVYSAASSNAVLTVTPDLVPPTLTGVSSVFPDGVLLMFSERIRPITATNPANYVVTGPGGQLAVIDVALGSGQSNIVLKTASQTLGGQYVVSISGLSDLARASNNLPAGTQMAFTAVDYTINAIGNPAVTGLLSSVSQGYTFTGGGQGIVDSGDQLTFSSRLMDGDFDLQVRVDSVSVAGAWGRVGLMARAGMATNAPFAASFTSPQFQNSFFQARAQAGGVTAMQGAFPANGADTWLRLRREGNLFSGFASLDGKTWNFLGSENVMLPGAAYVGFAISSGGSSTVAVAGLREPGRGSGVLATNLALPFEPLGPSSRRTALVFSEIMYNPPARWGGTNNLEFVELWNGGLVTEDLTGHRLTGDIDFAFPTGASIKPGQFLVIANDPAAAQAFYGVQCLGPYTNNLPNNGGTFRLVNELGGRLLEVEYDSNSPWPVSPDGTGHSLVLARPSYGEGDARAWAASDVVGGSPGRAEKWAADAGRAVVINEFLANSDAVVSGDFVELFNTGLTPVDLGGFWLSDDPGTNKFRIPDGTVLQGRQAISFEEATMGFSFSSQGEEIFLVNSNRTRVLDAVRFGAQAPDLSTGRFPDGTPGNNEMDHPTPGAPNSPLMNRPVVINEIMYHPISGSDEDEYIELFNRGTTAVSLAGWRLDGGVRFSFPAGAVLPAGGYMVVAENITNLLARYPHLNATNAFGNYDGALSNGGELLALQMPIFSTQTNGQGIVITNRSYVTVNAVRYFDGGRWGTWSDGGGSSLELVDPRADNRFAASWADSDESAKAPWTIINVTNILENGQQATMINQGSYYGPPNRFEFFMHDPGEVLVDDLEFHNNTGPNLLANGSFSNGTNSWYLGGTLRRSFIEADTESGGSLLHVVATDRGDAGPNKIAAPFTATVVTNPPNTGIVRARVRWLKGSPYMLFRTRGNWMEVSQRLQLPERPGTPGLPNSRLAANAGPVITDVTHEPVLPAEGQPVLVTARAIDVDGLGAVTLHYRIDPDTSFAQVVMKDDGAAGDAIAGDGIYSARIPGQSTKTLAAFHITARDGAAVAASSRFPANAPVGECLVLWGEQVIGGSIGTYRLWLTATNIEFWTKRERNANDPIDATFVYGNSRVVYNVETLYSGSPFHTPNYNGPLGSMASDYEVNFPSDELFLGEEEFVLTAFDVPSSNFFFQDKTGQADLTGNWIARKLGQPFNHRRHVHVIMNGQRRGTIYDDAQQPNAAFLSEYFSDDTDGELRKIEDWFEFADDTDTQGITTATLERVFKSGGGVDTKRYRWNWRQRATRNPDDWYGLTNMILAVNDTTSTNYLQRVRQWMDLPNFLRPIITHHIAGDWDSYGYERGKNMYAYRAEDKPWRLLMWDIELSLGGGSRAATDGIYVIHDPVLLALIQNNHPVNREYLRGYQDALVTALAPGAVDVLLDERYAGFQQNGLPMQSPQSIKTFLNDRRAFLTGQMPNVPFGVTTTNYQVVNGTNLAILTGTAPVQVQDVVVNGMAYPVTWTSVTAWRMSVPLAPGTNMLLVAGRDRWGNAIAGMARTNTVVFDGAAPGPEDTVVFNELMFQPTVPGAEYVELFNASARYAFDLAGWRVNGLGYTFPPGSVVGPRSLLVLAKDAEAFLAAYGSAAVFDIYPGNLDAEGETLTLLAPGSAPGQEVIVDRIRYEGRQPWPAEALGQGASAQLVDPAQDNSRAGNWASYSEWRQMTVTGTANASKLYVYLNGIGDVYIDDIKLVAGGIAEAGTNRIVNGDFEEALTNGWVMPTANQRIHISSEYAHSGSSSLHLVSTNGQINLTTILVQNITPTLGVGQTWTLSYWFRPAPGNPSLVIRLSGGTLNSTHSTAPLMASPGVNNTATGTFPPFPAIWLNEALTVNAAGIADRQGEREPWLELYNPGSTDVPLDGLYLSDNYTNLTAWAFPAGAVLRANEFRVVFADGEPGEATADEWHAGVRLTAESRSVVLSRIVGGSAQVVDYLNFNALPANGSYGSYPDGQPFTRMEMQIATPGAANNIQTVVLPLLINEWMAANTGIVRDPIGNRADDWFELFNPNAVAVDLGGHFLTDTLTNRFLFQVPNNHHYIIPPLGYLWVWADGEPEQNSTNSLQLHVDFQLRQGGEAIGLFAPDGTLLDSVVFGAQTDNVSQGRSPDGSANIVSLGTITPGAANPGGSGSRITASIQFAGNVVAISFNTTQGRRYEVRAAGSIGPSVTWSQVGQTVTGTGGQATVTDADPSAEARFYRVVELAP